MTEKAQKVLEKLKKRAPEPQEKDPVVHDDGPVAGGAQELKVLKEMNELESS